MEEKDEPKIPMFLDIPHAAALAGFSIRHFLRMMREDSIPIMQIGKNKKFFMLGRNFAEWEKNQKPRHVKNQH